MSSARALTLLFIPLLTHCASQTLVPATPELREKSFLTFDGDAFPYRSWLPKKNPTLVIIGVHGINGASSDYDPLAKAIRNAEKPYALYAPDSRGQGYDPIVKRRGDIQDRRDWYRDLDTFTALVRQKHPDLPIVWCGESMGSLIALHACVSHPGPKPPCDALVLASPLVGIRSDFPQWKLWAFKIAATLAPKARLSLESLAENDQVQVTKDAVHTEQAQTNPYHVEKQTLHLLATLGDMSRSMSQASQKLRIPTLILHGGKDVFSEPHQVKDFAKTLPEAAPHSRKYYPESFHLLFYDHQSKAVTTDLLDWVDETVLQ